MPICTPEQTRQLALLGVVIVVASAAAAFSLRSKTETTDATPIESETAGAPGRSEPASEEISLSFPVSGRIKNIFVKEGQEVKKDAVLAELENGSQTAQLAVSRAALREAEVELEKIKNGARPEEREMAKLREEQARASYLRMKAGSREEEIREAEQTVKAAEAALAFAKTRLKELSAMSVSLDRERLQQAEANMLQAQAELRAREARYELVKKGFREEDIRLAELQWKEAEENRKLICGEPRPEDVLLAETAVEQAQAQAQMAQSELDKTKLTAPRDCTILSIDRREGEFITGMQVEVVMIVGDLSEMNIRTQVDEYDIGLLYVGQRIEATTTAHGDKKFTGKVVQIGWMMGAKDIFTENANEQRDRRVISVICRLDKGQSLTSGLRMVVRFLGKDRPAAEKTKANPS